MLSSQRELRKKASPTKAKIYARFFKTGPGEYGEGDRFLGVTVPQTREVAKKFLELSSQEIRRLLSSPLHEERLLGLVILVEQYQRTDDERKKQQLFHFYLSLKSRINNWDLVDVTCHKILGDYCFLTNNTAVLKKLLRSKRHWDRRLAIVSTYAFIRRGHTELTFEFSQKLLKDNEDLMHKATGWMLREAGKRDVPALRRFLKKHGRSMPRTMLRYSIEKFPESERKKILIQTRA